MFYISFFTILENKCVVNRKNPFLLLFVFILFIILAVKIIITRVNNRSQFRFVFNQEGNTLNKEMEFIQSARVDLYFSVYFYHVPCAFINIDILDFTKTKDEDYKLKMKMKRYSRSKTPLFMNIYKEFNVSKSICGNCYIKNTEKKCCNLCNDVAKAFQENEKAIPPILSIEQCSYDIDKIKKMTEESCHVQGYVSCIKSNGKIKISFGELKNLEKFREIGINISNINFSHKIKDFQIGSMDKSSFQASKHKEIQKENGTTKTDYYFDAIKVNLKYEKYFYTMHSQMNYYKPEKEKIPMITFNYNIPPISVLSYPSITINQLLIELTSVLGGLYVLTLFVYSLVEQFTIQIPDKLE